MAYSLDITCTENSRSVADNTTNVTIKVIAKWTYGTWWGYSSEKYCTIDGKKYSFNDTYINPNATTSGSATIFSKTLNISHNSDGTKKLAVKAYTATGTSSGNQSVSETFTLTTIPRKSSVTATAAVVGSDSTITISRKSSSFTHTLKYTFGSLSGTIATKTSSTSVKFTLPDTFYAQIGSTATSKSGTITCETFSGSTSVGTSTCSFTAKTSSATCAPTLNPTVKDVNSTTLALTGDENILVKYYSTAAVTFGAAARNSATLKSKSVTNSGKSRTTDGNFTEVTSGTFKFSASDSRGYSTSKTVTKTLINYVKLSCTLKASITIDGVVTIKASGNYFNGSFGSVANTLTVEYRFKAADGEFGDWIAITPSISSSNTYSATATQTGLDYQTTYVVEVRAIDKLATINPDQRSIKALPLFDWGENDFTFNVQVNAKNHIVVEKGGYSIRGTSQDGTILTALTPCNTNNNLVLGSGGYESAIGATNIYGNDINLLTNSDLTVNDGSDVYSILEAVKTDYPIERGTSGDWRYVKWKSGWCECWKKQRVDDVVCTTAWGNGFVSANISLGSYPFAFSARPIQNVSIHQTSSGSYSIRYPYGDDYSNTASTAGYVAVLRPSSYSTGNRVYFSVYASGYLA